ncbi:NAD(P)/FAD-dependent oxidoreductase [Roseateles cellulosilyticus]|uniref:Ferredoxin--NADP reductase n=1 Tax=Pelomonas cellulosilytica TaxID=2906762 RepID=A0ABS8XV32_9BURK|nr:NAD(P)/FAD-dependent oxidoreductase [Pelomonas sp. P8]MCE4554578.1 NAD(P)/FAD-dependent oxidoreductase [Pelomonas sp. P8]
MTDTTVPSPTIETDALVIGAGPVGLFQVFELGLLGVSAQVVDALPHVGGQCVELYADKPIYDVPGLPVCSGRELVERLQQQIRPFAPGLHLGHEVSRLQREANGRWLAETGAGLRFVAKTVFIAAGVGAFQPKRLRLDGAEALQGRQLHYQPDTLAADAQQVLIIGGEEAAVQAAVELAGAGRAASVTLLHRRDAFKAPAAWLARLQTLRDGDAVNVAVGQPLALRLSADGALQGLDILDADAQTRTVPATQLLVRQGLSPRLGPIADWGLAMERKLLTVDTARFETSEPGIHAVGDINTYPGKRKLLVSGFHEATLAAFAAAERVFPGQPIHLQYTTTSPKLHERLGVSPPARD